MKKINKSIISFLTLISLGINSAFASGFPLEPMVIYGNIEGDNTENRQLDIYDENNTLIKSVDINEGKYGTNKTFDLDNKVLLNQFDGHLQFKIDGAIMKVSSGKNDTCSGRDGLLLFMSGGICEYNLSITDLGIDILDDLDNVPEEDKSEEFEDVFSGKVIEKTKEEVKQNLGDNIVSGATTTGSIVIVNKAVDVDAAVTKDLVLISDTQKELVFIPKDTNTGNSDLVIEKPVKITSLSSIKSKINKDVFGAIEIPTNNQVNFDKFIRICLDTSENSVSGLKIYASHDNNSWFFDSSARNLSIKNSQICFDVNHLTSFAVTKDIPSKSSGGGGSGWGNYKPYCNEDELVCENVGGKNYLKPYDIYKCRERNSKQECDISSNKNSIDILPENYKISLSIKLDSSGDFEVTDNTLSNSNIEETEGDINKYKLTSKKYITGVRTFISNKREVRQKYGLQVSYVKSDDEYNKTIDLLLKDINNNMKIKSIKQDMVKHIDTMTTSYGVANDESAEEDLRNTFKSKLENDIKRVQQKIKVLKRKDYIVNKALKERELRRLEQ